MLFKKISAIICALLIVATFNIGVFAAADSPSNESEYTYSNSVTSPENAGAFSGESSYGTYVIKVFGAESVNSKPRFYEKCISFTVKTDNQTQQISIWIDKSSSDSAELFFVDNHQNNATKKTFKQLKKDRIPVSINDENNYFKVTFDQTSLKVNDITIIKNANLISGITPIKINQFTKTEVKEEANLEKALPIVILCIVMLVVIISAIIVFWVLIKKGIVTINKKKTNKQKENSNKSDSIQPENTSASSSIDLSRIPCANPTPIKQTYTAQLIKKDTSSLGTEAAASNNPKEKIVAADFYTTPDACSSLLLSSSFLTLENSYNLNLGFDDTPVFSATGNQIKSDYIVFKNKHLMLNPVKFNSNKFKTYSDIHALSECFIIKNNNGQEVKPLGQKIISIKPGILELRNHEFVLLKKGIIIVE
ncbi:MAG: hypothetical protein IKB88_04970 [Clostridia bacterium]|nr:hypothetical protein [Clostridia bacterium]